MGEGMRCGGGEVWGGEEVWGGRVLWQWTLRKGGGVAVKGGH